LRGAGLRVIDFFGVRTFFATGFFAAVFLLFIALAFALFLATGLLAARFAFGRVVFAFVARRLAAVLDTPRRTAARDVERLRPLVTALMEESK
jgi:membrane protein implicated in regulation of membrane protease activity